MFQGKKFWRRKKKQYLGAHVWHFDQLFGERANAEIET